MRGSFLNTILDSESHWVNRPIVANVLADGIDLFDNPLSILLLCTGGFPYIVKRRRQEKNLARGAFCGLRGRIRRVGKAVCVCQSVYKISVFS